MSAPAVTIARDPDAATSGVGLLRDLLAGFAAEQVCYCAWKSTRRLAAAMTGQSDLDLLIAREDQHRARRLLLDYGFKEFPAAASRLHPAVASFLGYDEPSGTIVHVHACFRLVIGRKLLHEYRVPWDAAMLDRAVLHPVFPVRVLDAATEAVLLVVRACVELNRTDPVVARHWARATEKFELDRRDVVRRVDGDTLRDRAGELLGNELGARVADALSSPLPLQRQRGLRRRLRTFLAPHRDWSAAELSARALGRAIACAAGGLNARLLHWPRAWNRQAPGGGCVIAVVGVDGSGKSTVTRSLRAWLGAEVDVLPVYFGTGGGRPSLLLLPFKLLAPLVRRLFPTKPRGASHGAISDRPPGPLYSILMMAWASAVAVEKRSKLRTAHRAASRGLVVVTDRYPQGETLAYNDGPLLHRLRWAPAWLRRIEQRAYDAAQRMPPDLVIKLEVEPETAARREPDMNPPVIRERVAALRRLAFAGARVVTVDAEQPLEAVLRAARREAWRML